MACVHGGSGCDGKPVQKGVRLSRQMALGRYSVAVLVGERRTTAPECLQALVAESHDWLLAGAAVWVH